MAQEIEPDNCFYIKNEAQVRGKDRWDLTIDPPLDLDWEIDVILRTYQQSYIKLSVPELWRFEKVKLQINIWQEESYIEVEFSPNFPQLPLKDVIPEYLKQVKIIGINKIMKVLRNWVKEQLTITLYREAISFTYQFKMIKSQSDLRSLVASTLKFNYCYKFFLSSNNLLIIC